MARIPKRTGYKSKKVQIFFIFLVFAFLAWLLSKMSETYSDDATFSVIYENVPDSLFLTKASNREIKVRLRTTGFQFLAMGLKNLEIKVDLSSLNSEDSSYFMPPSQYRKQIERQLSDNINLLDVVEDTLYFDFVRVYEKSVPIKSNVTLNLAQNYLLEGALKVKPDRVVVRGPLDEIDTIDEVLTETAVLEELTENFKMTLQLVKPEKLTHTSYSEEKAEISGSVFKFSEAILEVPVQVLHIPEGMEIKTFPNEIRVLCKARVGRLKDLQPGDIKLVADYTAQRPNSQILQVTLQEKPDDVYSVQILEDEIEFILRRL